MRSHGAESREIAQQHVIETRNDVESEIQEYSTVILQRIVELP